MYPSAAAKFVIPRLIDLIRANGNTNKFHIRSALVRSLAPAITRYPIHDSPHLARPHPLRPSSTHCPCLPTDPRSSARAQKLLATWFHPSESLPLPTHAHLCVRAHSYHSFAPARLLHAHGRPAENVVRVGMCQKMKGRPIVRWG